MSLGYCLVDRFPARLDVLAARRFAANPNLASFRANGTKKLQV
jgi:hypothetical protein